MYIIQIHTKKTYHIRILLSASKLHTLSDIMVLKWKGRKKKNKTKKDWGTLPEVRVVGGELVPPPLF